MRALGRFRYARKAIPDADMVALMLRHAPQASDVIQYEGNCERVNQVEGFVLCCSECPSWRCFTAYPHSRTCGLSDVCWGALDFVTFAHSSAIHICEACVACG